MEICRLGSHMASVSLLRPLGTLFQRQASRHWLADLLRWAWPLSISDLNSDVSGRLQQPRRRLSRNQLWSTNSAFSSADASLRHVPTPA